MAIQPIAATLAAESHYNESSGYLRSWSAAGPYSVFTLEAISPDYNKKYIAGISFNGPISETITAAAITVKFTKNGTAFGQIKCSVITGDLNSPTVLSTQTFTPSAGSLTHTFSFSGLQVPNGSIRFMFETATGSNISYQFYGYDASATVTYGDLGDLTIQINPSSFYSGDSAVATIGNSRSRTLTATLTGNGYSLSGGVRYSGSKIIIESTTYWFTQAHVSSGNLPITVNVSDDLGRSVSGSATMLRRISGTFTPTSPKDTRVNGGQKLPFKWNYSGQGTLKKSELQFSGDGTTWGETIEVPNGETTYNVDAATLMPGTQYWRGKGFDDISGESPWSAAAEFEVYYNAVSQVVPSSSPTDGNISNYGPLSFSVALESSEPVPFDFLIDSAAFYWRSGTSGNYTQLAMTPSTGKETATVDIAAGTFPNGTLQWYASATDEDGNTSQTGVYTLTVVNSSIASFPVSPIDTIQSGTAPVLFIWSYLTLDGSAQNGAELEYSTNNLAWVPFAGRSEITGDMTSYTAPAGTFPGGVVYWRVRSYTQGNTPGPWSQPASFNVFAAPTVSAVVATSVPFTTITWQTDGQLAYEVEIDGTVYGPYRGETTRSFTSPEPLEDGLHTVRVRAQNRYGLWSQWADTTTKITNVPGRAVTIAATGGQSVQIEIYGDFPNIILEQPRDIQTTEEYGASVAVTFTRGMGTTAIVQEKHPNSSNWQQVAAITARGGDEDATLSYVISDPAQHDGSLFRFVVGRFNTTSRAAKFTYAEPFWQSPLIKGHFKPEYGDFLVYRDGVLIGKTFNGQFTDRTALGEHRYHVIQTLQGGYYTKSNAVTIAAAVCAPTLALLSGGDPIVLKLSETANRTQSVTKTGEVSYVQYSGANYPEAEIGEGESITATGDVSFTAAQQAEAVKFEAMLKKPVIYKLPSGEIIVGVLQGFARKDARFYASYSFSVTQMDWRDFADES